MIDLKLFISELESKPIKDGHNYITSFNFYKDEFIELNHIINDYYLIRDILDSSDVSLSEIIYQLKTKPREFYKETEYNEYINILNKIAKVLEGK